MNLQEAFDAVPKKRSGRPCLACVSLRDMPDEDRATFIELMGSSASSRVIYEACRAAGYEGMTLSALKRHRRGECLGLT